MVNFDDLTKDGWRRVPNTTNWTKPGVGYYIDKDGVRHNMQFANQEDLRKANQEANVKARDNLFLRDHVIPVKNNYYESQGFHRVSSTTNYTKEGSDYWISGSDDQIHYYPKLDKPNADEQIKHIKAGDEALVKENEKKGIDINKAPVVDLTKAPVGKASDPKDITGAGQTHNRFTTDGTYNPAEEQKQDIQKYLMYAVVGVVAYKIAQKI